MAARAPPDSPANSSTAFTREEFVNGIIKRKFKKIAVLTGAGISSSAGIPDFRSPKSGLYAQLKSIGFPNPEEIFSLELFQDSPQAFYQVANRFLRFNVQPTFAHRFIKALSDHNILLFNYTQNIDSLELAAGVPDEKVVQAHGHMRSARCCSCKTEVPMQDFNRYVRREEPMECTACNKEGNFVKPDIIFFGEKVPRQFQNKVKAINKAQLVIVMGTSLKVHPFSLLVKDLPATTPVVVVNQENPGVSRDRMLFIEGDIDTSLGHLVNDLGWDLGIGSQPRVKRKALGLEAAEKTAAEAGRVTKISSSSSSSSSCVQEAQSRDLSPPPTVKRRRQTAGRDSNKNKKFMKKKCPCDEPIEIRPSGLGDTDPGDPDLVSAPL